MSTLPLAKPAEIGFDSARWHIACSLVQKWAADDLIPAAGVCVGRKGKILEPIVVGRHAPEPDAAAIQPDALFLVASLSKPVTVAAVMILVERGLLSLDDKVVAFVPAFAANGKQDVRVRHLMTHTSGLPDMPPDNLELRKERKPLNSFIESTCRIPLLFESGTKVSYQSMGTAMLGEIVHQISGISLPEFLRKEIFEPLQMADTSLGWQPSKKDRIAAVRTPKESTVHEKVWNTPYWLGFGAPWGGLITSPTDYGQFCQIMLNGGTLGGVRVFSPASVAAMTRNQLEGMPRIPEEDRRCRPWGLGWRLNWPGHSTNFGDLLGPRSFGHWGSTGTLCWVDPDSEAFAVILTTQPQDPDGRFMARMSNAISSAIV